MKKCPYCAEEIQDEAVKCKHCGEFLDGAVRIPAKEAKIPFYLRTTFIVIVICCVGPLGLPLLWMRPHTALVWKILWTVVVVLITWLLWLATEKSLEILQENLELLRSLY